METTEYVGDMYIYIYIRIYDYMDRVKGLGEFRK